MEDLNIADDIFSKLQSELQDKSENLKNTQQEIADKKSKLGTYKKAKVLNCKFASK